MDKIFSFLIAGFFVLAVVLMAGFIFADSYDLVTSGQTAKAGETVSVLAFNVTNTSSVSGTNLTLITLSLLENATFGNISSVNISDGINDYSNGSITGPIVTIGVSDANTSAIGSNNLTINVTLSSSATYGVTFGINVTAITNETNVSYSALPYASGLVTVTESTAPISTAACSPSIIYSGATFPCTCAGSDSGATASGVSTSVGSSTSGTITSTDTAGEFTFTCTVTDVAGNPGTDTATYTVIQSGGGASAVPQLPKKVHSFAKITPGAVSIMKDFDSEIGLKEIRIEVNNEVQNVKITVTKHDGKPAQVTVAKSGKVYQYFEVNTENLGSSLDKATVRTRVEKTWVSSNGLTKDNVAVSKFDETNSKWDELTTNFVEEDSTYYYYDSVVDSFSYFSIGEKTLVEAGKDKVGEVIKAKGNYLWWIVIVLIALAAIWYYFKSRK